MLKLKSLEKIKILVQFQTKTMEKGLAHMDEMRDEIEYLNLSLINRRN